MYLEKSANAIHQLLLKELQKYIKTQYFGKSPFLFKAISEKLDQEGVLYREPYIEASPSYQTVPTGFDELSIPDWQKEFFQLLIKNKLGVFSTPFVHQAKALEAIAHGQDVFVSTGTGSGKTECFMWPLISKLTGEAREHAQSWSQRGVRAVIMYPMNALVADQLSRLRRLLGDTDGKFLSVFHQTASSSSRRPQFGMYTGRTPYPGAKPTKDQDKKLANNYRFLTKTDDEDNQDKQYDDVFLEQLKREGKYPAKKDLKGFIDRLSSSDHQPDPEDAELITRYEMQQCCPDILVTNYSMMEYMLFRPIESSIWEETKKWLKLDPNNKILFIIDEAHMYRGSAGGEVALLIRRFMHKLGIDRNRTQFVLTTASMPKSGPEDELAMRKFARDLTASDDRQDNFCYLLGDQIKTNSKGAKDIPTSALASFSIKNLERSQASILEEINKFCAQIPEGHTFSNLHEAQSWLYAHLLDYQCFALLVQKCRGSAVSLKELASVIFPSEGTIEALNYVGALLAILPLAKNDRDEVLFPARMHMLFQGIGGLYACSNPNCPHHHKESKLELGELFLSDAELTCPHCGATVYELYNDRHCGALFFKGYVKSSSMITGRGFLWRSGNRVNEESNEFSELHLFIPPNDYRPFQETKKRQSVNKTDVYPCYLNVFTGEICFNDDSLADNPNYRKLYYTKHTTPDKQNVCTFYKCPKCRSELNYGSITPFRTLGNHAFYNIVLAQFNAEPPVLRNDVDYEVDIKRRPNQGRKVLLFSDSRQQAAKLALDMSIASDRTVVKNLFALALKRVNESSRREVSLNDMYAYFLYEAAKRRLILFSGDSRKTFQQQVGDLEDKIASGRSPERVVSSSTHKFDDGKTPEKMTEELLRLYCGTFNTLSYGALSWLEPTSRTLDNILDDLEEEGIDSDENEVVEIFNAWANEVNSNVALGANIDDRRRREIMKTFDGKYGFGENWKFSKNIISMMNWNEFQANIWKQSFTKALLKENQGTRQYYVDLSQVKACLDLNHVWYRCSQCSTFSPYLLKSHCPLCGSENVSEANENDFKAISFWRQPTIDVLENEDLPIRIVDTEEHTAQLSHKDQREDLWAITEEFEHRFQDIVKTDERPIDILSCTTTMEVGVDIGSLVGVGLRNVPPKRENYQQRAGRAGRRGSSLSTIVTFCNGGPHDTIYFNNPAPMFRGDPRRPLIDIRNEKLLQRHLSMIAIQDYLAPTQRGLDSVSAIEFLQNELEEFTQYLANYKIGPNSKLLPHNLKVNPRETFKETFESTLKSLKDKALQHPELFETVGLYRSKPKSLLDVLYEEGAIPTYSFPKNVVSFYVSDRNGHVNYEVDRGLDVAISEYAPGRGLVVNKQTYQVGGLYVPGSDRALGAAKTPAQAYMQDKNYLKSMKSCSCGWFGLAIDNDDVCPFCGSHNLKVGRPMLRPWGFAPRNNREIPEAQLRERFSSAGTPIYSTTSNSGHMRNATGFARLKIDRRYNQRVIMKNSGPTDQGFMICSDCGASMPGNRPEILKNIQRPYTNRFCGDHCSHSNVQNVDLGFDFITDMLVLEIELDRSKLNIPPKGAPRQGASWLLRASQTLAEALRLTIGAELDADTAEFVTGHRNRISDQGAFVDVYLYDSLSSGAGYSVELTDSIELILEKVRERLINCNCRKACHRCLCHFQNQRVHPLLDRYAALQLLDWSKDETLPNLTPVEEVLTAFKPLKYIFDSQNIQFVSEEDKLFVQQGATKKRLVVYPDALNAPAIPNSICIDSETLTCEKPQAVETILKRFHLM